MSNEEKLQRIFDENKDIPIPPLRQKDYLWLSRNFGIHNRNHSKAKEVMFLLKSILCKKEK